jgi:hypothetical protein
MNRRRLLRAAGVAGAGGLATLAEAEASETADVTVARERGGKASVGGSGELTVETDE